MEFIDKAFAELFPEEGQNTFNSWQKAARIIEDGAEALDKNLALGALCEIVVYVPFPDKKTQKQWVTEAERAIGELLEINPKHELHMDECAFIYNDLQEGKTADEIAKSFRSKNPYPDSASPA